MTYLILSFLLTLTAVQGHGQDSRLNKLRKLGRDSLIARATARILLRYPGFDFNTFSHVRIMTGEDLLYAEFKVPYKLVPLHSAARYNLTVHLYGNPRMSYTTLQNHADISLESDFYKPGKNHDQVIQFLIDAAGHDDSITSIEQAVVEFGDHVTIMEKEEAYDVSIHSTATSGGYSVEKISGNIINKWHKHKRPVKSDIYEITE